MLRPNTRSFDLEKIENRIMLAAVGLPHGPRVGGNSIQDQNGAISGIIFNDYNSNGAQDLGEPGLPGWTVFLDSNDNGSLEPGERSTLTEADGHYLFDNLSSAQYVVREVLQQGYLQTYPGNGGVILGGGGEGAGDQAAPLPFSHSEIVVAFKGDHGKGALKQQIQLDQSLARLINYSSSTEMFTVRGVTLVEVKLAAGIDPLRAVEAFSSLSKVKWAQVNYIIKGDPREFSPNDPLYDSQYQHVLVKNNLAWDTTMGDPRFIIGITDDGTDFDHTDLYLNIWVNQAEIPATRLANLVDLNADGYFSMEELNDPVNRGSFKANDTNVDGRITGEDLLAPMIKDVEGNDTGGGGWSDEIDQGGNTYVDDIVGRDFWNNDNDVRPPGVDPHGTHVVGIAVGRTNNAVGIAGTAGRATVMPIRFWSGTPGIWTSTIVSNAYHYGTDNGAKIISTSYNIDEFVSSNDAIFLAALNYMYDHGVLHFNSAGNTASPNPVRQKLDQTLYVANTNSTDQKYFSSAWGWGIDISAPGVSIVSTYPNNNYQNLTGTSMATPQAAAIAALIWSHHPDWTREQVAAQLIGSADNIDALNPLYALQLGSGRVNSLRALTESIAPPRVKSLAGLPAQGATVTTRPNSFTLDLANVFDPATMNLADFELRGDGLDNLFGTPDDVVLPLTLTFGGSNSPAYRIGTNRLNFTIPGTMNADTYRLSMFPTAKDPFGQALDGNGDSTAGDAFTRTFTFAPLTNSYRISINQGQVVSNVHFGNHDIVFPRIAAYSFNFAKPHTLEFAFSEDVSASLAPADLLLTNLTTSQTVDTSGFSLLFDAPTHTVIFNVNATLPDGDYRATLIATGISDPSGNLLDGNGDGAAGDDFSFDFFFLMADANHDRLVDLSDFNTLAGNFGATPADFTQGDFNYDGEVNLNDFNILAASFGNSLANSVASRSVERTAPQLSSKSPQLNPMGSSALFSSTSITPLRPRDSLLSVMRDEDVLATLLPN